MSIQVIDFKTIYKPLTDGTTKEIDIVRYTAAGNRAFAIQEDAVSRVSKVMPLAGNEDNQAIVMANVIWDSIKPRYEAWKSGQEIPEEGTALGAWPAINQAIAEVLRNNGIRTVEEFANSSDGTISRINIPKIKEYRQLAATYLNNRDSVKTANHMKAKDEEVQTLKASIEELQKNIADLTKGNDSKTKKAGSK